MHNSKSYQMCMLDIARDEFGLILMMVSQPNNYLGIMEQEGVPDTDYEPVFHEQTIIGPMIKLTETDVRNDQRLCILGEWYLEIK